MYKLIKNKYLASEYFSVTKHNAEGTYTSIPFDIANMDFIEFKAQILSDKAILKDVDGNEMTAQQAKDFVKELP